MSILAANSHIVYREVHLRDTQNPSSGGGSCLFWSRPPGFGVDGRRGEWRKTKKRDLRVEAFWPDTTRPNVIEMQPIEDCDQLEQALAQAQELQQPIIIDWMADWCRKCIYLKPKLEKLAAEYDTKMKFYCVDVNKVPQDLVKRGNITKMPTIQLWKDREMKAEVIGGHKAWIVIDEVREMIQKFV